MEKNIDYPAQPKDRRMSDLEIHPALARRQEKRQRRRQGGKALDPTMNGWRERLAELRSAPPAVDQEPEEEPARDSEGDIRAETEAYDEAVKNDALDAAYEPDPVVLDVPDEDV